MSFQSDEKYISDIFPAPKPLASAKISVPRPWPGITPTSTNTLREILQNNHKNFHCFFNDRGFHNHIDHTALALWWLGANSDILNASYNKHSKYQRPAFISPNPITKENWIEHLGDENYYDAYMNFFGQEIASKGITPVIEEYIFSIDANHPQNANANEDQNKEKEKGKGKVEMLGRFLSALLHPMIHVGQGFEFNIPGMVIEGLGQTTAHSSLCGPLIPIHWFSSSSSNSNPKTPPGLPNKTKTTSSAFKILARIISDTSIQAPKDIDPYKAFSFPSVVKQIGVQVVKHLDCYAPDVSSSENLEKCLEEIVWIVVIVYAVAGFGYGKEGTVFNADFFYMHLVTSSIFLSSLLTELTPNSQILLLKSYLAVSIVWFVGRGKPKLDFEVFFEESSTSPSPSTSPAPSKLKLNPWFEIVSHALVDEDDHLPKLQRALGWYAQIYGDRKPGYFGSGNDDEDDEMKGIGRGFEKLDGTLFVRSALLTMKRMVVGSEGKDGVGSWDRYGIYT